MGSENFSAKEKEYLNKATDGKAFTEQTPAEKKAQEEHPIYREPDHLYRELHK